MSMNLKDELSSLSQWVYCWFLTIVLAWSLTFIWMWQYPVCCTLFVIPFLLFLVWWHKNSSWCTLNQVLKPFLHGYINITLLATVLQFIGLLLISILFAAAGLLASSSPVGNIFFVVIAITYYVSVEEALKLFFSLKARDSVVDPVHQITKVHTITSTATALGYSMATGALWLFFVAYKLKKADDKGGDENSLVGWLFLITLIIAVIAMPMHLITGYVTGCKITQKDIEWAEQGDEHEASERNRLSFRAYLPTIYHNVFVRCTYFFFLIFGFLTPMTQFSIIGAITALLGIICDYVVLFSHAKKVERSLPFDYLQRAGQLSIFGYNVLPEGDEADEEQSSFDMRENGSFADARAAADVALDINDNQVVQVTTASIQQFSAHMDEPMKVGANVDEKGVAEIKVHVRPEMLDETNSNSENDNEEQQPTVR